MTGIFQTETELVNTWGHFDPFEWQQNLLKSLGGGRFSSRTVITWESATQTLVTVPANSVIQKVSVVRTTIWDAITTFEVGKAGTTDWLVSTVQANVDAALTASEEGDTETIDPAKVVTTATPIVLTLNQGAASAGVGYVVVEYQELT